MCHMCKSLHLSRLYALTVLYCVSGVINIVFRAEGMNLALGRPTYQSSTWESLHGHDRSGGKAVDGNTGQHWSYNAWKTSF